jgi:streptogramin lyase
MLRYFLLVLVIVTNVVIAQNSNWSSINAGNSDLPNETIKCITFDTAGTMWVGTYMGGLAVRENNNWTIYNTSNSGLPHNYINTIAIDQQNVKWIGTDGGGLARFDGTSWEIYKTSNSGLPSNVVMSVFCDDDGIVWIGTYFGGLARFDGENWKVFNDENSPLLSNKVVVINKDKRGNLWFGTQGGGVASFDGANWIVYNERNSKLPSDYIYSIDIDNENNKWIGTGGGGVAVFNDIFWISYNFENSDLTDDNIRPIYIDVNQDKWIGTYIGGINIFNGETWKVHDYQNSGLPDDEITCFGHDGTTLLIGTERSGIIVLREAIIPEAPVITEEMIALETTETTTDEDVTELGIVAVPVIESISEDVTEPIAGTETELVAEEEDKINPVVAVAVPFVTPELVAPEITQTQEVETEVIVQEETEPETIEQEIVAPTLIADAGSRNKIVLMFDAADVHVNDKRLRKYERSFKLLLKNRERIDDTYDVFILIYSSNFDVNPREIEYTEKDLSPLYAKEVVYLDGESTFTDAIKKAYNMILADYNADGNNHVIATTNKFIRDDETAKQVIKENAENNYILFSLLAFDTESMKMQHKMRNIIPKGEGYYYAINPAGIKDNWSVTGQIGLSAFRGDIDVNRTISFPGVIGFAINKQVLSTGLINGGVKGQFNFGKLQGEKNNHSFENKYKEGCLNFQVILNKLPKRTFRFEKFRPYAFAGIGFINYRVLLRNGDGTVVNGYGFDVTEGNLETNGDSPEKSKAITDVMIPLGLGVNYKLNDKINIELEASSRFIASDKLDGKLSNNNDKYWFISLGVSYSINSKEFLSDILNR